MGTHRAGDRRGRGIGVDVVGLPGAVGADGGDDGDVVLGDVADHVDVGPLDLADEADVLAAGGGPADDAKQRAVIAAETDRRDRRGD